MCRKAIFISLHWATLLLVFGSSHALKGQQAQLLSLLDATEFRSDSLEEIENYHADVRQALDRLVTRLSREPHGQSWLEYLQLQKISHALNELSQFPVTAPRDPLFISRPLEHLIFLETASHRLYGNVEGLEMPEIMQFRDKLAEVTRCAWRFLQPDGGRAEFDKHLTEIRTILDSPHLGRIEFQLLDPHVRWCKQHGQASRFVGELEKLSHPNLVIYLSRAAIKESSYQVVDRQIPVDQTSNGRHVQGLAKLKGTAHMVPLDSHDYFAGQIQLEATVDVQLSSRVGRLGIEIASTGVTSIQQPFLFDGSQFLLQPAGGTTCASLDGVLICTPRSGPIPNLVRRASERIVQAQRSEIEESISRQIAEDTIKELESEATRQLEELSRTYSDPLLKSFNRIGIRPQHVTSSSTQDGAILQMIINDRQGLAASSLPPRDAQAGFAQFHVHESLFNSLFHQTLAGRTINDLQKTLEPLGLVLHNGSRAIAMGMTFSDSTPVTLRLNHGPEGESQIELRISGTGYRYDLFRLSGMDFLVRYRVRHTDEEIILERSGFVEVLPPKSGRTLRFVQQREIVMAQLQSLFPKTQSIPIQQFAAVLGDWNLNSLNRLSIQDGWLSIEATGSLRRN